MSDPLLIFATVGTDHHPFTRLVRWLDEFAEQHRDTVEVIVQHGHAPAPVVAQGHSFLSHGKLHHLTEMADLVVCHGGPGTILDARRLGHLPICVPRDPTYGEHVDAHQLRFAAALEKTGRVEVCRGREELLDRLGQRLVRRNGAPRAGSDQGEAAGAAALSRELDSLLSAERPRRRDSVRRFFGRRT